MSVELKTLLLFGIPVCLWALHDDPRAIRWICRHARRVHSVVGGYFMRRRARIRIHCDPDPECRRHCDIGSGS